MITCTRRLEFDAAHRLINHESKCRMLHGHRYVVEATFSSIAKTSGEEKQDLDEVGRVIDFGRIKEILGSWIEDNFDHNTILNRQDQDLGNKIAAITGQKIYYLNCNPTAENLAFYLQNEICPQLFANKPYKCSKIKIFETPNCWAET